MHRIKADDILVAKWEFEQETAVDERICTSLGTVGDSFSFCSIGFHSPSISIEERLTRLCVLIIVHYWLSDYCSRASVVLK